MSSDPVTAAPPSVLGSLVLARLLIGEKGATLAQLRKDLDPLVAHRWTGAEWTERLERTLEQLESDGSVVRKKPLKGKIDSFVLAPEGRTRALASLDVEALPPKTTWAALKKSFLPARALGLPGPKGERLKSFSGKPGFKAAALRARFDLPLPEYPKGPEVERVLLWKLLGFPENSAKKFDIAAVKAAVLQRELGDHRAGTVSKQSDRLLAKTLGARNDKADELRLAALRQWLDQDAAGPPAAPPTNANGPPPQTDEALELKTFAARVLEAARSSPSGRFGDKVFIAHVWRAARNDPALGSLGLDEFKHRLGEANQVRLLDLSRADMVEAMDQADVHESETRYQGATFHFVRAGGESLFL
jgi:hypothetical protein